MSIPGSGSQGVSRTPAVPVIAETQDSQQPPTTATTPTSPSLQSRQARDAAQKLRDIYLDVGNYYRNAYLDQKIGKEMAAEFTSGSSTKNDQAPDVDSADFEYQPESFRLLRELISRQEYEALGLLLEKCPRINEEPVGPSRYGRTEINFDKLDESKVASLVRALNCSAQPVALNIECTFDTPQGCEKAIKFLGTCTKLACLSLRVKPGDERLLECISRKKEIKNLYCFGFKDCKDNPGEQPIRAYLNMLSSMSHLEKIELIEKEFKDFPAVLGATLKSMGRAQNLKSLYFAYADFPTPVLQQDFTDLISKLPLLSVFIFEFTSTIDLKTQMLYMEDRIASLQKNKSVTTLHITNLPIEEHQSRFFELVSSIPSVTDVEIYNPQYLSIKTLKLIQKMLRENPRIVKVFSNFNNREWAKNLANWKARDSAQESCKEFLLICDLLDKNRARASLAEKYSTSFSDYHDDQQTVALYGPSYLPADVGNLIAANVLDLSPSVKEFEGVMRAVNRSAWEAELQNHAQAGTGGTGNAEGPIRTTTDAVTLTTTSTTTNTTTTTTTPGSGGVGSPTLQAASHPMSSAATAEGAKPAQSTEAEQTTTPQDGRIDPGYESDVFIESSDDDE